MSKQKALLRVTVRSEEDYGKMYYGLLEVIDSAKPNRVDVHVLLKERTCSWTGYRVKVVVDHDQTVFGALSEGEAEVVSYLDRWAQLYNVQESARGYDVPIELSPDTILRR